METAYLDYLFRFPPETSADLNLVRDILDLIELPVIVVNSHHEVLAANPDGRKLLAKLGLDTWGRKSILPEKGLCRDLKEMVSDCLSRCQHLLRASFPLHQWRDEEVDLLVCPGEVEGCQAAFTFLLPVAPDVDQSGTSLLRRLLDGFAAPVSLYDSQLRFQGVNRATLNIIDFDGKNLASRRIGELGPDKTVQSMKNLLLEALSQRKVIKREAFTYELIKKGKFVTSVIAWPLISPEGECVGVFITGGIVRHYDSRGFRRKPKRQLLESVFSVMTEAIFITDLEGNVIVMNRAASELVATTELREQKNIRRDIPWDEPALVDELLARVRQSGYAAVLAAINLPGHIILVRFRLFGLKDGSGSISRIVFIGEDVTESERMRKLIFEKTRRLAGEHDLMQKVIDSMDWPIFVVDRDLRILRASRGLARRLRTSQRELVGRKIYEVNPTLRRTGFIANLKAAFRTNRSIRLPRFKHITNDGRETLVDISIIPLTTESQTVCAVVAHEFYEEELIRRDAARNKSILSSVKDVISEGVAVVGRDTRLGEANDALGRVLGIASDSAQIRGVRLSSLFPTKSRQNVINLWKQAISARRRVAADDIETMDGKVIHIEMSPIYELEDSPTGVVMVVWQAQGSTRVEAKARTKVENLPPDEREVASLESILSGLSEDLDEFVGELTQRGDGDRATSLQKFVARISEVVKADYVNLAIVETSSGPARTETYAYGALSRIDSSTSFAIEKAVAELVLGNSTKEGWEVLGGKAILSLFRSSGLRCLLAVCRSESKFTTREILLIKLLCSHLASVLPTLAVVDRLRSERERAECIRRIAFRVVCDTSVKTAMNTVATELAKILPIEKVFWVMVGEAGVWVSDVYGQPVGRDSEPIHVPFDKVDLHRLRSKIQESMASCCCERLSESCGDHHCSVALNPQGACPFASLRSGFDRSEITNILEQAGKIGGDIGTLGIVPVRLPGNTLNLFCTHSAGYGALSREDVCFICLSVFSVECVWQLTLATSNIRRLEATGETVAELAHDLKYPLMRVKDFLSRLSETGGTDGSVVSGLSLARKEIESLTMLLREIIEITNRGAKNPELVDITSLLSHCISLAEGDLKRRGIKIERHTDEHLPPVFADKGDVMKIFFNLLANCSEAVRDGGWIKIRAYSSKSPQGGSRVQVCFEDSGPGVPFEMGENLFNPFFTTKEGGSGLGLFIARKRACANGGDVTLERDSGGRSKFVVWFPAAFR